MLEDELWMRQREKPPWNRRSRFFENRAAETEFSVFEFWDRFGSVFRKPISDIFIGFRTPLLVTVVITANHKLQIWYCMCTSYSLVQRLCLCVDSCIVSQCLSRNSWHCRHWWSSAVCSSARCYPADSHHSPVIFLHWSLIKVKGAYGSSWDESYYGATGHHLPHGITQCYLPPDTSECAPP